MCLGNICRSPTAEAIFRKKLTERGIVAELDSAGTANYHVGHKSDSRSIHHAEKKGYSMTHLGRQVEVSDFHKFDLILAMDSANFSNLLKVCNDEKLKYKIKMMTDYCNDQSVKEVPDPYHGTAEDFEKVIDILENCVEKLISKHF